MNRVFTAALLLSLASAGCGDFELRSIVLDLRVLAMTMEPPEVVIPFDPDNLPDDPSEIEVSNVQVCALVADPAESRSLEFAMTACGPTDTLRCDDVERPVAPVALGTVDDPEEASQPVEMCGTLLTDFNLFSVLEDALNNDSLSGFGGVELIVDFSVRPPGGTLADAEFAAKHIVYAPQIPAERVANNNPSLDQVRITREDGEEIAAPLGRCGDVTPVTATIGEELTFEPIESADTREDYVVPAFDGTSRMFTENHTYSWYATTGDWQRQVTGGPRDLAGNDEPLDSRWTAPEESENVGDGLDVRFWIVQRDERGGLTWYETCVRVTP